MNIGEGGVWDGRKTVADVQKVVETVAAFWGTVPYDQYVFFNLITQASGAVEHKAACTHDDEPLGHHLPARLRRLARPRTTSSSTPGT